MALSKYERRERLRMRIRKTVEGTESRPRLAVFR
ncbi:MAG TPA: 50S ribosomal protein L18, partial [Aequorivita sp.]|nr:50S ribosomal protein L18 [Aequorivita sp.]